MSGYAWLGRLACPAQDWPPAHAGKRCIFLNVRSLISLSFLIQSYSSIQNQRKTTRNSLVFGWSAFSYLRPHLSRVWAAPGFASAVIARQPFYGYPAVLLLNLLPLHYLLVRLLPLMHYILPLNYLLLSRSCCNHKVAHRGPWAMQCLRGGRSLHHNLHGNIYVHCAVNHCIKMGIEIS